MLRSTSEADWLRSNAAFDVATEAMGFRKVGNNVRIHMMTIIPHPENIEIGDNVRIDAFTILSAREISIGSHVHIGAHCVLSGRGCIRFADFSAMSHQGQIFTSTDNLAVAALTNTTVPDDLQALVTADVEIGRHAIIGAGGIVMSGVKMGECAVLGAQSYARMYTFMPKYTIWGGTPARFIKERAKHISVDALRDLERRCRDDAARS